MRGEQTGHRWTEPHSCTPPKCATRAPSVRRTLTTGCVSRLMRWRPHAATRALVVIELSRSRSRNRQSRHSPLGRAGLAGGDGDFVGLPSGARASTDAPSELRASASRGRRGAAPRRSLRPPSAGLPAGSCWRARKHRSRDCGARQALVSEPSAEPQPRRLVGAAWGVVERAAVSAQTVAAATGRS